MSIIKKLVDNTANYKEVKELLKDLGIFEELESIVEEEDEADRQFSFEALEEAFEGKVLNNILNVMFKNKSDGSIRKMIEVVRVFVPSAKYIGEIEIINNEIRIEYQLFGFAEWKTLRVGIDADPKFTHAAELYKKYREQNIKK